MKHNVKNVKKTLAKLNLAPRGQETVLRLGYGENDENPRPMTRETAHAMIDAINTLRKTSSLFAYNLRTVALEPTGNGEYWVTVTVCFD